MPATNGAEHSLPSLTFNCPHCGAGGSVPVSRLDRSFVCPECDKPFHIDAGRVVRGERKSAPKNPYAWSASKSKPMDGERGAVGEWLDNLSPEMRLLFGVGMLTLLVGLGAWGFTLLFTPAPPPRPRDEMAQDLGRALVCNNEALVRSVATSTGRAAIPDWIDRFRPDQWPPVPRDAELKMRVSTSYEGIVEIGGKQFQEAGLVISISEIPVTAGGAVLELSTVWIRDLGAEGEDPPWQFDVKRTMERVPR